MRTAAVLVLAACLVGTAVPAHADESRPPFARSSGSANGATGVVVAYASAGRTQSGSVGVSRTLAAGTYRFTADLTGTFSRGVVACLKVSGVGEQCTTRPEDLWFAQRVELVVSGQVTDGARSVDVELRPRAGSSVAYGQTRVDRITIAAV